MKPKEIAEVIRTSIHNPSMPALHLWGPPGVGKSRLCAQITKEDHIRFIDMRFSMMDYSDIKGIPFPEDGRTKWLPPSELPREGRGLLLLDEFNLAPPLTQASGYQLVLDRKVGEYTLPDGWIIIAAGNRSEHGANVFKMAAPLRNRFIHIDFEHDVEDWTEWAIDNRIVSEVIEFIRFRPDLLFAFKPDKHENAFPTPRSWEFVSKLIQNSNGLKAELRNVLIEGTVGEGAAIEFRGYLQQRANLPSIDEILAGKNHIPKDINIAYALVTALAIRANPNQFERLLQYSSKLATKEVAALMFRLMLRKDKKAVETSPSWKNISMEYFDLLIG